MLGYIPLKNNSHILYTAIIYSTMEWHRSRVQPRQTTYTTKTYFWLHNYSTTACAGPSKKGIKLWRQLHSLEGMWFMIRQMIFQYLKLRLQRN